MKKHFLLIITFLFTGLTLYGQDALAIVTESRDRIKADTTSIRSKWQLRDRNGNISSERTIDQYSKDGPRGSRTVIVFQAPAGIAGTRFLTMENPGNPDDRWIFLPRLGGEPNRISVAEGASSFQGTDFSTDDISSANRRVDLDNHRFVREDFHNGAPCYVIESTPKDSSYQYSRMVQWIDKNTKVPMKLELFNSNGVQVKLLEVLKLEEVQGQLTIMSTRMTTLASGTSTTINNEIVRYNENIPESVFTREFLRTGRPR